VQIGGYDSVGAHDHGRTAGAQRLRIPVVANQDEPDRGDRLPHARRSARRERSKPKAGIFVRGLGSMGVFAIRQGNSK